MKNLALANKANLSSTSQYSHRSSSEGDSFAYSRSSSVVTPTGPNRHSDFNHFTQENPYHSTHEVKEKLKILVAEASSPKAPTTEPGPLPKSFYCRNGSTTLSKIIQKEAATLTNPNSSCAPKKTAQPFASRMAPSSEQNKIPADLGIQDNPSEKIATRSQVVQKVSPLICSSKPAYKAAIIQRNKIFEQRLNIGLSRHQLRKKGVAEEEINNLVPAPPISELHLPSELEQDSNQVILHRVEIGSRRQKMRLDGIAEDEIDLIFPILAIATQANPTSTHDERNANLESSKNSDTHVVNLKKSKSARKLAKVASKDIDNGSLKESNGDVHVLTLKKTKSSKKTAKVASKDIVHPLLEEECNESDALVANLKKTSQKRAKVSSKDIVDPLLEVESNESDALVANLKKTSKKRAKVSSKDIVDPLLEVESNDSDAHVVVSKKRKSSKKRAKLASMKSMKKTTSLSLSNSVEIPEHHCHVLKKLFGRKNMISWSHFSEFIKEHFCGPKEDPEISVEAEINENDEEELMVFYQSNLLQAALMPTVPCTKKGSSGKLNRGDAPPEIADFVTLKDLVEILGDKTLKDVVRPFAFSKDSVDAEDVLDAVVNELKRRAPDADERKPLSESYLEGFFDLAEIIIRCGIAQPSNEAPEHDENGEVIAGGQFACDQMLLHYCKIDDLLMVNALLNAGADPNAAVALNGGQTPLFFSSLRGNLAACRMLLEAGADINKPKTDGSTPLNIAAEKDHFEICELLVAGGADCKLSTKDKWNPFANAVHNCSLDAIKLLLDSAGADVNCVLGNGYTPLTVSAVQGDLDVFRLLLSRGANPLVKTRDGKSIQDMAARNGRSSILDFLGSSDFKTTYKKWKNEKKKKREERGLDTLSSASKKRQKTEPKLKMKATIANAADPEEEEYPAEGCDGEENEALDQSVEEEPAEGCDGEENEALDQSVEEER